MLVCVSALKQAAGSSCIVKVKVVSLISTTSLTLEWSKCHHCCPPSD